MGSLPEAREPGELWSVDVTEPYTVLHRGNKYLLTCMYYSKWAEAILLADQEAPPIARAIVTKIFFRHGVCKTLLSDRGRNFTSSLVREICKLLGVKKVFIRPYRAQCSGQVEQFHRTLHTGVSFYLDETGRNRDDKVDYVLWAYRAQLHSITRFSPFYLLHGLEMPGHTELS
jgi:transposase InsO family protein